MLESMMQNPRPTRAEASDVANAVIDGTDAVMLSGETAAGQYPREAVRMMARLVAETEKHILPSAGLRRRRNHDQQLSISEAVCESTAHIAEDLNLGAIAIYTESGTTARLISKYRPRAEVYAFAHIPVVCNRLNLLWGIRPIAAPPFHTVEAMVTNTENFLLETGVVQAGDVIGIVAGTQSTSGSTNFIRLDRVGEHREV
jgi:pyruvate kinase